MNKKDIVNRLYEVFIVNKATQNSGADGRCLYTHDNNGYGCAVGCLLPADVCVQLDTMDDSGITYILDVFDEGDELMNTYGEPVADAVHLARKILGTDRATINVLSDYQSQHDYSFDDFLDIIRTDYFVVNQE